MQLETYFDFLSPEDIRIKGTRVGIEIILSDYLDGYIPEEIARRYPAVSLEDIYAAITYYLHNQTSMDAYLEAWREHSKRMHKQQEEDLPDVVERLRRIAQKRREDLLAQGPATRVQ